jgi:phage host-nuclease inhibitor protein Gam
VKTAAADYPVPQTRDQVVEAIAAIGRCARERTVIEAVMNKEISAIRQRYETDALPLAEHILALACGPGARPTARF